MCVFWAFLHLLPWLVDSLDFCFLHSQRTWPVQEEEIHTGLWTKPEAGDGPKTGCQVADPCFYASCWWARGTRSSLNFSFLTVHAFLRQSFNRLGFKSYWHLWGKIEEEKKKSRHGLGEKWQVFFEIFFFFFHFYFVHVAKALWDDDFVWFLGSPWAAAAGFHPNASWPSVLWDGFASTWLIVLCVSAVGRVGL